MSETRKIGPKGVKKKMNISFKLTADCSHRMISSEGARDGLSDYVKSAVKGFLAFQPLTGSQ